MLKTPAKIIHILGAHGGSVALSADGLTLAVSAIGESSKVLGLSCQAGSSDGDINGIPDCQQDDCATATTLQTNCASGSGAVYLFQFQRGILGELLFAPSSVPTYIKASNSGEDDRFGYSVALSADGLTLAVGAIGEDSAAVNIGGTPADDCTATAAPITIGSPDSGAVYLY